MWFSAVVFVASLLVCCGKRKEAEKKDESLVKQAGAKVGETLTEFAAGVGAGVDTKMTAPVELSPDILEKGLSRTVAKSLALDSIEKGFSVYLIAKRPVTGTLVAKAFNKSGEEIGRSKVKIAFESEDAKYVSFTFDRQMDSSLVAKYLIDIVQ